LLKDVGAACLEYQDTVMRNLPSNPTPLMSRVASLDAPIGFSRSLESYVQPDKDKIIAAVRAVMKRKR
jgi:pyruvate/2-oxoglutarate/acetoin dehydrogenase E1 component